MRKESISSTEKPNNEPTVTHTVNKGKKERPVLVEVYKWKDGKIEVFNGGTVPTAVDEDGDFEFNGKPCNVQVFLDGAAVPEKVQSGVKEVVQTENGFVDATEYLGLEYLAGLTDDEIEKIKNISFVEIHDTVVNAIEKSNWTPFALAMQSLDQILGLPRQNWVLEKVYEWRDGRTVIWFDVRLSVNGSDVSKYIDKLSYELTDRAVPLVAGTQIAERKYCVSGDEREFANIYRFYIPRAYFK